MSELCQNPDLRGFSHCRMQVFQQGVCVYVSDTYVSDQHVYN